MTDIVVACIAAGGSIFVGLLTLIGVIITNSKSNKKSEERLESAKTDTTTKIDELTRKLEKQQAVSQAVMENKLEALTLQVEKHNKVIERVYNLEKHEELIEEKLKVANNRIHDLEEYHK